MMETSDPNKDPDAKLVLGIEGGGSKTDWVYLRQRETESEIVKQGQLPPSNLKLTDEKQLLQMMRLLPLTATHVGVFLAGCVTESDRSHLRRIAEQVWPSAVVRTGSDRESALAAAFGDGDGIVVISGTGSAVTGRKSGKIEKAGGRGHLLGDRGGGYFISMEGLRLALRTYDLEQRTSELARNILRQLALTHMEDLIDWVQAADKSSISALTPVLFESAKQGDREMLRVIESGALALARYTESVARRLGFAAPPVRLLGGVFLNQPMYEDVFQDALAPLLTNAVVSICRTTGACGAAWLASKYPMKTIGSSVRRQSNKDLDELSRATTEQSNPRSENLDRLDTDQLIDLLIGEEINVMGALEACKEGLRKAINLTVEMFQNDGRLFYVGAGTSGRLGVLDASEIPPTFGENPERVQGIIAGGARALSQSVEGVEDDEVQGTFAIQQRGVTPNDVVCGITASGRTPFVLAALRAAKNIGAKTILLTCNPKRSRNIPCDVELDLPTGPEVLTGSTRLKAGSATKAALNILSTCTMIKLGKVKGNRMVDLVPVNQKMRFRSVRLVSHLKQLSQKEAEEKLQKAGWNIRKALED